MSNEIIQEPELIVTNFSEKKKEAANLEQQKPFGLHFMEKGEEISESGAPHTSPHWSGTQTRTQGGKDSDVGGSMDW
jgi:hypothetical protein